MFEAYHAAERAQLTFDFPVITSMLTGKKVIHINDNEGLNSVSYFNRQFKKYEFAIPANYKESIHKT